MIIEEKFQCSLCNYKTDSLAWSKNHNRSKKHVMALARYNKKIADEKRQVAEEEVYQSMHKYYKENNSFMCEACSYESSSSSDF